jgi:hypothetical protein
MNDPREMAIKPQSGAILEQDNRHETTYQWGAMILDLCDMPVSEYMKPMTVIGLGGGDIPEEEVTYTLKFVIDGKTIQTQTLSSGEAIVFDIDANKEGRNFKGWFYGSTQYSEGSVMPSRNLTLTAKYECEVTFMYLIDGEEEFVSAYTISYNSKLTNIPNTNKTGYDFKGWEPSTAQTVTSHTTYVGVFEKQTFTVTWNGYTDGSITQTYSYGDAIIEPEIPSKKGYSSKWDKTLPETVTSNLVFNAIFTVNQYKITYYEEYKGEKTEINSVTKDYGKTISLPSIPSEKGYTYSEWQSEYTGTTVPDHEVQYVTVKTINTYILAYYDNGELVKQEEYEYMEEITPYPYQKEKEGWIVSDWENLPETMPYNNVSAHCTSEIMRFVVVFVDQNDNVLSTNENVPYGTMAADLKPEVPEGYSYSFDEIVNEMVKDNMTINVVKTKNFYNVTINDNIVSLEYETDIEKYVRDNFIPEEGYNLFIESITHTTVPANDSAVVVYVMKANIWALTYSTEGTEENLNGTIKVAYGTNILPLLPPTEKEGYTFSGWYNEGVLVNNDYTMPNHEIMVTGTYNIKEYTVTIVDGDEKNFEISYTYGTPISEILSSDEIVSFVATESANGYTITFQYNGEDINEEMILTEGVTLTISRTPNEYILTFKNDDEVISEVHKKYGEVIEYLSMDNKTENGVEYVFVWNDTSYDGKTMPAHDLTIVGNYQKKAEAPIYFGTFKVATSDYDSANTTQYFDEEKLGTKYYSSVNVSECVGDGAKIEVPRISDEYYVSLNAAKRGQYKKATRYPYSFVLPNGLTENYIISLIDGANLEHWDECVTDGQIVMYNGNEYKFYVYYTDVAYPVLTDETMPFTLKLIKK